MINSLSVFFPAVNEAENISQTVEAAKEVLETMASKWEIIVINDGSVDETGRIAQDLSRGDERIRVISHKENLGYGGALQSGFYNSRYDWIVYNDSDGQFDFSEITRFVEKMDEADLILGWRIQRKDSFYRKILAKGWATLVFLFFGLRLKDVDCGFKMVRKAVIDKIPHLESQRGGMINAELAIKAKEAGFKIKQVGVTHYPRRAGRATGAQVRVIIKSFLDLFRLWKKLRLG
jgi:glycosyltransferase involved in cell wall biosynthesis